MNATHFHLAATHFPIVGTFIAIFILIYGLVVKNLVVQKTSLVIFILMALIAVPVYFSGESAEETVEHLPGVSENIIHQHEEMAETAIVFMGILGVMSIISLFSLMKNLNFSKFLTVITLLISLLTFGFYAKTGNLGGQIRHTELRANTNSATGNANATDNQSEDDDDD